MGWAAGSLATPRGNCVNPACGHPIRTNAKQTPETEGMRRATREGVCYPCKKEGYQEFAWTPELLEDAVKHAMGELFGAAA